MTYWEALRRLKALPPSEGWRITVLRDDKERPYWALVTDQPKEPA